MQRDSLEKLIEYIARGPISNERLEIVGDFKDKKVRLQLKTPYSDGTTHLLLSFSEFIEKLVALIPPPKAHLVRWGGVLAPNSPLRKMIILKPKVKKAFQFADCDDDKQKIQKNYSWSRLLAKVFKIDVTQCSCGGNLRRVSAVHDGDSIRRYLRHLGLDPETRDTATNKSLQPKNRILRTLTR